MFLIELLLSLAIAGFLIIGQTTEIQKITDKNRAVATAQYMTQLQAGINSCINQGFIDGNTPAANYWTELQQTRPSPQVKCLNDSFSQKSPIGLTFTFTLAPAGCKADTCTGHAYSTSPLVDFSGNPRTDVLAKIISNIGVDGGMSYAADGTRVIGYGNSYNEPNPAGNVKGTVTIKIGANSGLLALLSEYYRLDGTRKLTGDMDVNNHDIKNINNIDTNTITFDQVDGIGTPGAACVRNTAVAQNSNGNGLVICRGNIWQRVGDATTGIAVGGGCTTKGLTGTDAVGTGFICNGIFWVENKIFSSAGSACAIVGQTAQNTTSGEELICRNVAGLNKYIKLSNLLAKNIEMSRVLVQDGSTVPKPTCEDGGVPAFTIVMMHSVVDVANIPPKQGFYQNATDAGANWSVQIRLTDNNGGNFSANTYGVQAIFKSECVY
jgi:hypothetical protein